MQESTVFGPYTLENQLGKGGMATVYKARHARLDRYVAIKVMHSVFLQDETFRTRFEREAQIVARLEHPNIVPIYDYSEHDGSPYLVIKYVDGVTLKHRMLKSGVSLQDALNLMRPIADALDYAHRQGVLHRDLKPSNILIDQDGKPYLTDFGLARMAQVGESTISHDMMLGTPFYVSPEQAQGLRDLNSLTDVYSFGIILYELITGSVPFNGDSAYAIVHAHIYAAPTPPSEVNKQLPKALDAVLLKALAKQPQDRYATASALMDAFAQAIGAQDAPPVQSTTVPPAQSTAPIREAAYVAPDGRTGKVETSLDLGEVNWSEVGERVKRSVTGFASMVEARVEEWEQNSDTGSKRRKKELSDEERIRKRIEKQQEEFNGVVIHGVAYFVINVIIWTVAIIESGSFPWGLMFMTGGWGIGMAAHAWEYYSKYGPGARQKEERIAMAIEEELGKSKHKNDLYLDDDVPTSTARAVRLTEDGELTDSYVEDLQERRARR